MFSEWMALLSGYASSLVTAPSAKLCLGFLFAVIEQLLGLSHAGVQALMLLMLCDYILGAAHAWKDNRLDFSKLKRGVGKFVVYGLAINIVWLADEGMGIETMGVSLRNLLCAYLSANEALSALTHLSEFGFPFPPWLKGRLRHYRDSVGNLNTYPDHKPDKEKHDADGPEDGNS